MKIVDKITHAWNAFKNEESYYPKEDYGLSTSTQPLHRYYNPVSRSKFAQAIFNRIALDVAVTNFRYVKIDEKTQDAEVLKQYGLHTILTHEANIDQNHIQFLHDLTFSMFDEGVVAVVPVDTDTTPAGEGGGINYLSMRVGRIVQFKPSMVRVNLYDDRTGMFKDVWISKKQCAIIENPLYAVINGPNSTLTRLLSKLNLVDNLDQIMSSGRLDIIIQLPYQTQHAKRQKQAQERIENIEKQLGMGNNGIAYTDANEKVIQLNRAANSQLLENANMLKKEFYNQLGLTPAVLDGTASEQQMRMYYVRTINPIINSILAEFNRKFISKKARTMGHIIEAHRPIFELVPAQSLASIGDTFKRNSIMTSNEIRKIMGFPSHNDPNADLLVNPNMPAKDQSYGNHGSVASPGQNGQNGDNTIEEETNGQ